MLTENLKCTIAEWKTEVVGNGGRLGSTRNLSPHPGKMALSDLSAVTAVKFCILVNGLQCPEEVASK
jgi:hypothetical protein